MCILLSFTDKGISNFEIVADVILRGTEALHILQIACVLYVLFTLKKIHTFRHVCLCPPVILLSRKLYCLSRSGRTKNRKRREN